MALTILERPEGHQLSTTANIANVYESYGAGDAQFVAPTVHGLVDGDFIYAESDIEDYAGFWYVDAISTGIFKIKPYANGDYVQFINSGTITWYASTLTHGWSAVHLPITYRISNNLYPTLSGSPQSISSVTNSNGYSVINLSGSLGAGVNSYDFVKLDVVNDTDLSGIYQILEFISPTVMIINLAYDSTNNFTSALAYKHYNNYNVIVRVYAGINSSHMWNLQKPYELAATLELVPDENNEVFFSINEILKSYIQTRNNLTLGTLPNNIDFWTQFYIETAESYDDSDGYTFGTYTGPYTSDQVNFEGTAVNAKLEFKNLYSGYMSDYLMVTDGNFLTLFDNPVIFEGGYQDISFLKYIPGSYTIRKTYYINGASGVVETETIEGDDGVYRVGIEANCSYDRVDMVLESAGTIDELTDFINVAGAGIDWTTGAAPSAVVTAGNTSDLLRGETFPLDSYSLTLNLTRSGGGTIDITVNFYNSSLVQIGSTGTFSVAIGTTDTVIGISATQQIAYIGILFASTGLSNTLTVNSITPNELSVSETKTFKIDCGCAQQEIRLCWLNNLGGFDYWAFTGQKDHIVEIQEALTTKKNILPQWPKSYGSQADTIKKQTLRVSNKAYTVRSQFLTEAEADAISYIKSSVLVQIINSRTDRRTVIVDNDSFVKRKDGDNTFEIAFNISFTDDIPVQTV